MANIGYTRVSSYSQNLDRQLTDIKLDKVFSEKKSAKDTKRPELQACIEYLREGDTLHVHALDRLARNLFDLQSLVKSLTDRGISVQFHKESLTFTGNDGAMSELLLHMLGAIAQFERSLINERRKEGMAAAKAAGKQIGAKPKLVEQDIKTIKERLAAGESNKAIAADLGISRTTLYKAIG